ncbi:MAG: (deoxy)nucleoside triphosphate pyrophosphohydrolase [Clostridiales bacterium]|nr:(deoxy)nucleoside triphosphate pyrophosphohydrolase [Clostridiales bacterium]
MKTIEVVAALLCEGSCFLICRRPPHKSRGGLYEFVGGKVEPGETPQAALVRECKEELGVTVSVGAPVADVVHAYPDLTIHLQLFRCAIAEGAPQLLEHDDMQWISTEALNNYPFCPADIAFHDPIRQALG